MAEPVQISFIVQELERQNLLPAIVFRSSRNQCDIDAERAGANQRMRLPIDEQRELRSRVHEIIRSYDMDQDLIATHPHYNSLLLSGVGAHHAGQLLMWRLLLEELMASGLLRVLVATGTIAAGVDFPARTVVITAHSKRGSDGFRKLTSAEFQQMSGRAGRRGKDTVGFCLAAPSPFCDARALLQISKQPPEPLVSAYFPGPSTVLNLLRYRSVDGLRYTVERSLAAFSDRRNAESVLAGAQETAHKLPEPSRAAVLALIDRPIADMMPQLTSISDGLETVSSPGGREAKKQLKRIRRNVREALELSNRQLYLLDTALSGLQSLEYLEGTHLSTKGEWAANLCTNLVLELGEIIEAGLLHGASAEALVSIIAALSGDPHRTYLSSKKPVLRPEQVEQLGSILERVQSFNMPGVVEFRTVLQSAAYTALSWLQSESWQEFRSILVLSGVAEGDAARLITQTAEHLNQITRLQQTHFELAMRAEEAKRRLLRPPLTEAINLEVY